LAQAAGIAAAAARLASFLVVMGGLQSAQQAATGCRCPCVQQAGDPSSCTNGSSTAEDPFVPPYMAHTSYLRPSSSASQAVMAVPFDGSAAKTGGDVAGGIGSGEGASDRSCGEPDSHYQQHQEHSPTGKSNVLGPPATDDSTPRLGSAVSGTTPRQGAGAPFGVPLLSSLPPHHGAERGPPVVVVAQPGGNGAGDAGGTQRSARDWAEDQSQFASLPPLPPGWIRARSRKNGDIYYVSMETGEATFSVPTGPSTKVDKDAAGGGEDSQGPLPPGWVERRSRSTGRIYYLNNELQKSQFERPTWDGNVNVPETILE